MSETSSAATSGSYPATPLQNAMEIGRIVADAGGANGDVQKATIAHALKSSDKSGAFLSRIASARVYGFIVGSRNGYRLSEEAKRYFHPSSEAEKRRALLMLLKVPPIFADIIKRFDGTKLPSPDMLANVLLREFNVPDGYNSRVARFFVGAAKLAGALDEHGFLRYVAARQSIAQTPAMSASASESDSAETVHIPELPPHLTRLAQRREASESASLGSDGDVGLLRLGGTTVRIETSGKLSPALWNLLNAYVQALKPSKEENGT